ncbi:Panacea domain-containing protein [Pseudomonas sp. NBRC 111119]|uniref:Panacea domain-containing protein n=1 Tax=Pseudomonas sp. NBRC 111119 TaxID=1661034 RepID=UPI000760CE0F|nr:type II toxin-antitoxin system antitoxin SocA domain-containing protein [Pseudomonas sp. NBRC 111119]
MLSSESVANYFIQKSFDRGVPLTPMQVLKLVYISHGWFRGYFSQNLINDAVQAWRYGPVIPDLYRKLKHYGRGTIDSAIPGYGVPGDYQNPLSNPHTLALLDRIWEIYGGYTGVQLSAMTHQTGTPWDQIWHQSGGDNYSGAIIPNELIERHYKEKISA